MLRKPEAARAPGGGTAGGYKAVWALERELGSLARVAHT